MSRTGRSLVGFGAYVLLVGLGLYLIPGPTLDVLRTARTSEHWIRLLGATAIVRGGHYIAAGRADERAFARRSLAGRLVLATLFGLLVVRGLAPVLLLGIAGNELLGVLWTTLASRADARDVASTDVTEIAAPGRSA